MDSSKPIALKLVNVIAATSRPVRASPSTWLKGDGVRIVSSVTAKETCRASPKNIPTQGQRGKGLYKSLLLIF